MMESIRSLAASACAAIRYRTLTELLNVAPEADEARQAQRELLAAPRVAGVLAALASTRLAEIPFHGYDSTEAYTKILVEHGVAREHPDYRRLVDFLAGMSKDHPYLASGIGRPGRILDDQGLGGSKTIRAAVLAHAGLTDAPGIEDEVQGAVDAFASVTPIRSVMEIAESYRGKLVYRPGLTWPGYYHLKLLAYTHQWRSPANLALVGEALKLLAALSPLPQILARHGSQLVAPAGLPRLDLRAPFRETIDDGKMIWLAFAEMLARLGLLGRVSALRCQIDEFLAAPEIFTQAVLSIKGTGFFLRWGAYTGLALEDDWRTKTRRMNDALFRLYSIALPINREGNPSRTRCHGD